MQAGLRRNDGGVWLVFFREWQRSFQDGARLVPISVVIPAKAGIQESRGAVVNR